MKQQEIAHKRLAAQQVTTTKFKDPGQLIAYMGAMQAQDLPMAKWAVGLRLQNATESTVETALDNGDILRTHLMRPTWHFVSPDDIYWLLDLTAPQIHTASKSRHQQLGITSAVIRKCNQLFEKAMAGGRHCTRDELVQLLVKAKIAVDDNRAAHLFMCAELDQVICSGRKQGNKQTYALLAERVPTAKRYSREESLGLLATRYFQSHGPATLYDFVWWSGLSVTESKKAIESVKTQFVNEQIGKDLFLYSPALRSSKPIKDPNVYLLPTYDEFLIAYKDRSAAIPGGMEPSLISTNGIFRSIIVTNGQVTGLWKRTKTPKKILIEPAFFKSPSQSVKRRFMETAKAYSTFLQAEIEVLPVKISS